MSQVVFKGDQNLAWDAIPTDYWLTVNGYDTRFFIQDEKLGTPDFSVRTDKPYQITTDYTNKHKGIIWIHQDISVGPFYVLPIEPKQFKHWGFHFKHITPEYDSIIEKFELAESLKELGIRWSKGRLVRAFSESENYFGLVPTNDEQRSISSYHLDSELIKTYACLFIFAVRGALKTVEKHRRPQVMERAKLFHSKAKTFIAENPDATISCLQQFIWGFLWSQCFAVKTPVIARASDIFKLTNTEISNITLTTLLQNPVEFADSYNEALTKARLPLKRLKLANGSMELPYFLECDDDEGLVRWRSKASFFEDKITLSFTRGQRSKVFDIPKPVSFANLAKIVSEMPCCITLIGKAGPLITELSRPPVKIALPEKGSKYTPMVGHLTKSLQAKGIDFPSGQIIRIGMDALNRLGDFDQTITLPDFLASFYGKTVSSKWFASNWRESAKRSETILETCNYHPTQLVTVARFILHELEGTMPNPLPARLANLGNIEGISKPLTAKAHQKLKGFMAMRENLLEIRRTKREKFEHPELLAEVEKAISLIVAGVFKRHAQNADLSYLNRRPYAFSFWLCFGGEIVEAMGRLAKSRIEEC